MMPVFPMAKSLAEFAPAGAKIFQSVFSGDMRLGKNTSQPASVRASPARECAQRAAIPLQTKALGLCLQFELPFCIRKGSFFLDGGGPDG